MKHEFEIISHNHVNFKLFLINVLYRNPHTHKDLEICYLLEGSLSIISQNREVLVKKGGFFVINSFQTHELKADSPVLLLSMHVSPSFFAPFYPQFKNIEFTSYVLCREMNSKVYDELFRAFIMLAQAYFKKDEHYELKCAGLMNYSFSCLLEVLSYRIISDNDRDAFETKLKRIRKIIEYIDANYSQKLLLSDIAEKQQLSLSYLSHFFKDCFGMSFQEYLLKVRCECARNLLLLTHNSLLDISINCGFSDTKYFNNGFKRQYGCSPKEYRKKFKGNGQMDEQKILLTNQELISPGTSLLMLERQINFQI